MAVVRLSELPKECQESKEIGHSCEKCRPFTQSDNSPNAVRLYAALATAYNGKL